jgi:aminobenzoyl-glutamate transport protein
MVENFITFPPLGIVLVAMLGIGLAERSGLLPALIERALRVTPQRLLTPAVVFIGIMSSMALDAGYVVLPPLAAALYHAAGRPPLAGLAAAFAGVSAGFSANLFITGLDPLLAGFTQTGAQILDPGYRVAVTANWWLMIASAFVLTAVGWWVTARYIEPRFIAGVTPAQLPPAASAAVKAETAADVPRALRTAGIAFAAALAAVLLLILVPGAPLHGQGGHFSRWVEAMVPLLFLVFIAPGSPTASSPARSAATGTSPG